MDGLRSACLGGVAHRVGGTVGGGRGGDGIGRFRREGGAFERFGPLFEGRDMWKKCGAKGLCKVMTIGEAVVRFFFDTLEDHLVEGFGDLGSKGAWWFGWSEEVAGEKFVTVLDLVGMTGKGCVSNNGFVQADAHAVHIGALIGGFAAQLFGGDVQEGSEERACLGEFVVIECAGDAEVCEFDDKTFTEKDIGRFDIAMDDAVFVGKTESCERVFKDE